MGGEDFDITILDYIVSEFKRSQGIDLKGDKLAVQRLREAAEKAKIELSSTTSTDINLPFITADATGPKHLAMTLTRAKLETLVGSLLDRTTQPCREFHCPEESDRGAWRPAVNDHARPSDA